MTTTTEATPTLDELRERLAEEQQEAEAAEAALGAAALDHESPKAASRRVAEATAAVARTEAGIRELERRQVERERHQLEVTAAFDRQRSYAWAVEYLQALLDVVRLQEQVKAASDRLGAVARGVTRPIGVVKEPGLGKPLAWDLSTMDENLIHGLPNGRMSRFPIHSVDKDWPTGDRLRGLGADKLEARIARAQELAAQEAEELAKLERGVRNGGG